MASAGAARAFADDSAASYVVLEGASIRDLDAVGNAGCGTQGSEAVRWTRSGGIEVLPRLAGYESSFHYSVAHEISWNGRVICGTTRGNAPRVAWKWNEGTGTVPLEDLDGENENGIAEFLSGNGMIAAGNSNGVDGTVAVIWEGTEIVSTLGSSGSLNQIVGLNFDGSRVLVWSVSGSESPYTIRDSSFGVVHTLNVTGSFYPYALSAMGTAVVGQLNDTAARWTPGEGVVHIPGLMTNSTARSISADERVIAGQGGMGTGAGPWIWDAHHGVRLIKDLMLEQLGVTAPSGLLLWGMSANGRTIAMHRSGSSDTYLFRMAAPCAADIDDGTGSGGRDDAVTIDDLSAFLVWMGEGDVRADLDDGSETGTPDLSVTIDDLLYFLVGFEAGC